jgi:hypothetical protein
MPYGTACFGCTRLDTVKGMESNVGVSSSSQQVRPAYDYEYRDGVMTIRWNRSATPEESALLMQRIASLWKEDKRYAVAMITHPDVNADARHRKLWGEWHAQNKEHIDRCCLGMAITLDSAPIRALMTAISWFARNNYPVKYVRTEAEAVAWARAAARGEA